MTRSYFTSEVIILRVGGPRSPAREPASTPFYVHRSALTAYSPVFRAMFRPYRSLAGVSEPDSKVNSNTWWREAQSDAVVLDEDRAADWSMLCNWMYADLSLPSPGLSAGQVRELCGLDLLDAMIRKQPSLHDEVLHHKVLANLLWRLGIQIRAKGNKRLTEAQSEAHMIDTSANAEKANNTDRVTLDCFSKSTFYPSHAKKQERPAPPALGPLIRLYVLADKYAISRPVAETTERECVFEENAESTLQAQIVLRLRAIYKLIHVVPDREDIARIWDCIPRAAAYDPMKVFILDAYAGLNAKNLSRILCPPSDCRDSVSDVDGWQVEFLMDLLMRRESMAAPGR